ncbi:beta-N-acetylglucosaminidase domain-containing protein [Streptomyces sp. NPDC042898]|uniref:beta-N-acetylglucosaminidase domain-containing protein n=1 Tax=Streptomyces sp. NPDC042898 TaxID=3154334 RepID=UPI0033DBECE7
MPDTRTTGGPEAAGGPGRALPRIATAAALALALGLPLAHPAGAEPADPAPAPAGPALSQGTAVTPTPQQFARRADAVTVTPTVTLVTDPRTDPAALQVVEKALRDAGARTFQYAAAPVRGQLTVHIGGVRENPATAGSLTALGVPGPAGLPADGYVLAAGRAADGTERIALSGTDARGTYYAAQSLRQLLPRTTLSGARLQGVTVRDWPAAAARGVVEGFYDTPWTHATRLGQLDYYGEHKLDTYIYSPKDDPYLRAKWREPYPAAEVARIRELSDRARARHVDFTYAVSPGLSVCYSAPEEAQALVAKLESVWDIGVRSFSVPLDDISYTTWNCAADEERFGTGGAAAGEAQALFLNRVNDGLRAAHPDAAPLQTVPTEYYDLEATPYKKALETKLAPGVLVQWTGTAGIAPAITRAQAAEAKRLLGHDVLLWDNFPVNDYVPGRLMLGPLESREKGLPGDLAGYTANPMPQADASKIGLFTVAEYLWNDRAYDPATAWTAALAERAGGDRRVRTALRTFADGSFFSRMTGRQSPELAAAIACFRNAAPGDRTAAAAVLDGRLAAFEGAPAVLRADLPDRGFVEQTGPWLNSAEAWGTAARTALALTGAVREGDTAEAARLRALLPGQVAHAQSFTYTHLYGLKIPVIVADGVLDAFVLDAIAEHDRFLGVTPRPKGFTNLEADQENLIPLIADGDDSTHFRGLWDPKPGAYVGLDLRAEREIGKVELALGATDRPQGYPRRGVVEHSLDGTTWQPLGELSGGPDTVLTAPAGTRARYVRLRTTEAQTGLETWLTVREIRVG